jgi:hypothetical protein
LKIFTGNSLKNTCGTLISSKIEKGEHLNQVSKDVNVIGALVSTSIDLIFDFLGGRE